MGSLLAARHGEGRTPPLLLTLTLTPAILFWWIAPTIHLNYVTGNELSVQSGLNEAQGLFLLTLPQHSLLLLITVRACRSDAARPTRGWVPSLTPLVYVCVCVCVCVCVSVCVALFSLPLYSCWEALIRERMRTLNLHSATAGCFYMSPDMLRI